MKVIHFPSLSLFLSPMVSLFIGATIFSGRIQAGESTVLLPALKIEKDAITISGVSSGAFMAIQVQVALSSLFRGVGSVAGGVYRCSEGSVWRAQSDCMKDPSRIDLSRKIEKAREEERDGNIDDLKNLKQSQVYIFSSPKDESVAFGNVEKIVDFYSQWVPRSQIFVRDDVMANHGWITRDYGNSCSAHAPPWINNCGFDLAGEILEKMYGPLRAVPENQELKSSQFLRFQQNEFNQFGAGMNDTGVLFVPSQCANSQVTCKLHVALHGCQMNSNFIHDEFFQHSGFNRWAEANNILILYPQVKEDFLFNPKGCWDWWGHTSPNYANKKAPQIRSIEQMVRRLMGKE